IEWIVIVADFGEVSRSSVRRNFDNILVLVAVSAFPICGLRHPMKLVPFATRVRMDVKAFPSRPVCFCLSQIVSFIIGYVKCAHFIHDSITLTSSESNGRKGVS
ncbi:conserved hypothetical protein, partial [Trichinella spiralis]|uniref:hypothetical protein n=1 Tax=Trichinella spiralis TaxID=6334 RepID=UPI0001EFE439